MWTNYQSWVADVEQRRAADSAGIRARLAAGNVKPGTEAFINAEKAVQDKYDKERSDLRSGYSYTTLKKFFENSEFSRQYKLWADQQVKSGNAVFSGSLGVADNRLVGTGIRFTKTGDLEEYNRLRMSDNFSGDLSFERGFIKPRFRFDDSEEAISKFFSKMYGKNKKASRAPSAPPEIVPNEDKRRRPTKERDTVWNKFIKDKESPVDAENSWMGG